jgi:hypothetical protein
VIELWRSRHGPVEEVILNRTDLGEMEGGVVTMSTLGIVEMTELDGRPWPESAVAGELHRAYQALVERECAGG